MCNLTGFITVWWGQKTWHSMGWSCRPHILSSQRHRFHWVKQDPFLNWASGLTTKCQEIATPWCTFTILSSWGFMQVIDRRIPNNSFTAENTHESIWEFLELMLFLSILCNMQHNSQPSILAVPPFIETPCAYTQVGYHLATKSIYYELKRCLSQASSLRIRTFSPDVHHLTRQTPIEFDIPPSCGRAWSEDAKGPFLGASTGAEDIFQSPWTSL